MPRCRAVPQLLTNGRICVDIAQQRLQPAHADEDVVVHEDNMLAARMFDADIIAFAKASVDSKPDDQSIMGVSREKLEVVRLASVVHDDNFKQSFIGVSAQEIEALQSQQGFVVVQDDD